MRCQFCNCMESKVIDSRPTEEGNSIRRRRECINCGRRFTTYEKIETLPLMVVKRDGRREPFEAKKVRMGMLHACEKLPVSAQQIEEMCARVEQAAYRTGDGEISTESIGEMVMSELKKVNDVAYVRFAAVYRKFTDLGTFMEELQRLLNENKGDPDHEE
ncbi:MAG: transcriptional repressor NrdR [Clostridia bacterium]|nr:transcriptional repressor NrdR [Clostridia bacterium]